MVSSVSSAGPMMVRTTGSVMRPWKRPNTQIMKKILKKEMKMWEWEDTRRERARREEKPPFITAGAMFSITNSTLAPGITKLHNEWEMMNNF